MTYDELNEIILRGDPDEWLSQDQRYFIYKGDLNLRIEMIDRQNDSRTGERFSEPWSEALRTGHPATRQIFGIIYGGTLVMEVETVLIDHRATPRIPRRPFDHEPLELQLWQDS